MIPKGLFSQLALLGIAAGVVMFYVQPQFENIASTQDLIVSYQEEREKVVSVNSRLRSLTDEMDSVSIDDRRRLYTYLPDTVDSVAIQRDLKLIADEIGVTFEAITYSESSNNSSKNSGSSNVDDFFAVEAHSFSTGVTGTYTQIKDYLSLLERNDYPLEVQSATLAPQEGGFMNLSLEIVTYAHAGGVEVSDKIDF